MSGWRRLAGCRLGRPFTNSSDRSSVGDKPPRCRVRRGRWESSSSSMDRQRKCASRRNVRSWGTSLKNCGIFGPNSSISSDRRSVEGATETPDPAQERNPGVMADRLYVECRECLGTGQKYDSGSPCSLCFGTGRMPSEFGTEILALVRKYIHKSDLRG